LDRILALVADVSRRLPLESAAVDLCLLATVLHDLVEAGSAAGALAEVARVVKPGGLLAIVEFKKIPGPPGPPLNIRLAPAEVAALVEPYGFQQRGEDLEVGPYNYLLMFARGPATAVAP
jgi:ubiquinone/menaquinone biosynthesis C-methylase UbiE